MNTLQCSVASARRSPEVTVLETVPVDATYRVVSDVSPVQAQPRARGGAVQFFLEFGWALTNAVMGLVRAVVGLGMPLGVVGIVGFFGLYFLTKHDYALTLAGLSAGVAFVSFTLCYLSGLVEAAGDRFIAKGRKA